MLSRGPVKGPAVGFALHSLGDVCFATGRHDEARDCFEKALELEPDDPQGHFNLAEFHYDNDNLIEAEKCCRKAIALDPDFSFAYLTLGNIYLDQEQIQESLHSFREFLKHEKSPASKDICAEVKALIEGLQEGS
jgi:tetratricopeptide (TPR) repeat protein